MLRRSTFLALAAGTSAVLAHDSHQHDHHRRHHGSGNLVQEPNQYVNPFIGTSNAGDTYPGAATPFGMIALSPQSTSGDSRTTPAPGGYAYSSTAIRGFSLTHVSGVGCEGANGDIPILPYVGNVTTSPSADTKDAVYVGHFSHANEFASPGYYRIGLDSGAAAEVTVTPRTGFAKFTFPADQTANLLFRTSTAETGSANATVHIDVKAQTVSGSIDAGDFCGPQSTSDTRPYYTLHFVAHLDQPFASTGTWKDTTLFPNTTDASGGTGWDNSGWPRSNTGSGGYVTFAKGTKAVNMRVAISYVSLAGAETNLAKEQPKSISFEKIEAQAKELWTEKLLKIQVGGGTDVQKTIFYTALYHAMLEPTIASDVDGSYYGADNKTHSLTHGQKTQYGTFSGWDQYRAQVQLLATLDTKMASDYAQSLFNYANQRGGEWDRWLLEMGKTSVMSGDPSAAAVAAMYAFGARDFDAKGALKSLVKAATVQTADDESDAGCQVECVGQRPSLDLYLKNGWVPAENCHCWGGAAETLEDSAADYGISQLAHALGDTKTYQTFLKRSHNWRNVFDHNATGEGYTGWMRDRYSNGSWYPGFSPDTGDGFVEGTSAQYTWMVYSDMVTLAQFMGGNAVAVKRLDSFFRYPNGSFDFTAAEGNYDPTNEPDIQTPFLYNYLGAAYKTQETVSAIISQLWSNSTAGIPGNDDAGTMSSWFVWAALGLYPAVPTRAELILTTPLFPNAVIHLSNGHKITISAPKSDDSDIYVQGLTVDGKHTTKAWLEADAVIKGATLSYTLSKKPSKTWGSGPHDVPPQN